MMKTGSLTDLEVAEAEPKLVATKVAAVQLVEEDVAPANIVLERGTNVDPRRSTRQPDPNRNQNFDSI